MATKDQQAYHPATTNGYNRSDEEATATQAKELRRQKYKKWIIYGIAFIIFQSAVIAFFSMTVMKVRNPKFRVRSASFGNIPTGNSAPFNLNANVTLGIKNTNFGPYKYDNSTITFYSGDSVVGTATIPKSKAQFRRTKKFTVPVDLVFQTSLASSGTVPLRSEAKLTGKVELMLIFKKKKAVNMNCTMDLNSSTKMLENIKCK
ncbi:hypothetical protein RHGRI_027884 [Rhododendron griersonianum]|uniref:Late embryogenesis abundant protein LEA-2 subgroup domain-containing protein n=1 Tax=Rhododendron griersonianum TaxID=479676 RepID=A0AAV6IYG7_9ERIC|nr:hypothetical protein RHGRI_027884 [Rhododendron griersonianum]